MELPLLKIYTLKIELKSTQPIAYPEQKILVFLRAAMGRYLRKMFCIYPVEDKNCKDCPVNSCQYRRMFSPTAQAGKPLSANESISRPFVFSPVRNAPDRKESGYFFTAGFNVFGSAVENLSYFLAAIKMSLEEGTAHTSCHIVMNKAELYHPVKRMTQDIYNSGKTEFADPEFFLQLDDYSTMTADRIAVNFITPAIMKDNGVFLKKPDFKTFIKRLRDRYSSLSQFYADEKPDMDFKGFADGAENVKLINDCTFYNVSSRKSRTQKSVQDTSGIRGRVEYSGDFSGYLKYILLGQYLHVGKSSVFGYGNYEVEILR